MKTKNGLKQSLILKLFSLIILNCYISIVFSQETGFPLIRNYKPKEYNNEPQVWEAIQDKQGIMYFGLNNGIMEYDGVSWKKISNTGQVGVYSFAIDSTGTIYVGAISNLGFLTTDKKGNTAFYSLMPLIEDSALKHATFRSVICTSKNIYFRTYTAILQYSPLLKKLQVFQPNANNLFTKDFVFKDVYYVIQNKKGLMKIENNQMQPVLDYPFFMKNTFNDIIPYNYDSLLFVSKTTGAYFFLPHKDSILHRFTLSNSIFFENNMINKVFLFQKKYWIFGSVAKGALLVDKNGKTVQKYDETNFLQNNNVYKITTDTNQNIWLGLSNGISKTEHSFDLSYWDKNANLKDNVENVIRYNETVYIATLQNLYFIDKNNRIQEVKNTPTVQYWSFLECKNLKKLLVSSLLGILEIQDDEATFVLKGRSAYNLCQSFKNPNRIYSTGGDLLISIKYENDKWISEGYCRGIRDNIRKIIEDENGDVWLGTLLNGLIRVTPDFENITKPKKIRYYNKKDGLISLKDCLPFKYKNTILCGTENGLSIYNSKTDKFEPFCELGEPFCNGSRDIVFFNEMPDGKIWIHSSDNKKADIGYLQPNTKSGYNWIYKPFRRIPEMQILALYVEPSGIVWIGGSEGLYRYDMNKDTKNYDLPYKCIIRKVNINADSLLFGGSAINLPDFKNTTELKYQYNSLKFEFAAPFFDQEEKTLYSYKLTGYDHEWSKWNRETKKEYTNLFEGTYTFQVKARNVYDVESETATYKIRILPPWYRTIWAFLGYFTLFIVLIRTIVVLNSRRLKNANIHLEKIVIERTHEIAQKNISLEQQKEEIKAQSENLKEYATELEKLSIVASKTDNAVIIMDSDFNFEWINEGFTKIYGYTFEELITLFGNNLLKASNYKNIHEIINTCITEKKSVHYESLIVCKNSESIWTQTTITPIVDNLNRIKKMIAIDTDITDLKNAERVIKEYNDEILTQNEEIRMQNEEILTQKKEIEHQNLLITIQNEQIKGSIRAAKTIQNAILPNQKQLTNYFDNFILYLPKDIVSGDFYWHTSVNFNSQFENLNKDDSSKHHENLKIENPTKNSNSLIHFLAVADCTGHGVSGAFMSMIGSRLLNEIVNERKILSPKDILGQLRDLISISLNQDENEDTYGMDISLSLLEPYNNGIKLTFSGAQNDLFYYSKANNKIEIVKADRIMLDGRKNRLQKDFTNQTIYLEKEDIIYMATDGIIDQNNMHRKRFGMTKFLSLLQQMAHFNLSEQKATLEKELFIWMEDTEQRDDITVLAIKI